MIALNWLFAFYCTFLQDRPMQRKVCVVAGVGPGIGKACCELYASKGYTVIMMARNQQYLEELAAAIGNTIPVALDLSDEEQVKHQFSLILSQHGSIDVLIYNAARGAFGNFLDSEPKDLQANFAINTMGLLYCARAVAPSMIARGSGSIMVTSNTAATRGGANFAMFAPSKGAARLLAQSMAKYLHPKRVHVALLIIDAAVDGPFARKLAANENDDFFIQPSAIAETIWFLDQQPENSWTFELDLRPHRENW
jgi:NADP-dependent 3-hydroxy acid dehydrogenase YdfG